MNFRPSKNHKRPAWKKARFWLPVLGILLVAGSLSWYFLLGGKNLFQKETVTTDGGYHTTSLTRGSLVISASGSGTLISGKTVDLSFTASGTVSELNVKLGDKVTAGQMLATLGNSDSLQASLAAAQLANLEAQKTLTDLQTNSSLALAQAYQDYITAQGNYEDARDSDRRTAYARCSQEVNTKYAAALDNAKNRLDELGMHSYGTDAWINAKNNYDTALANYTYCKAYTPEEITIADAALKLALNTMDQAEKKYNTLNANNGIDPDELALAQATLKDSESKLAKAQEDMEGITLKAPMAGTVVYLAAGKGEIVDTSLFITIADLSQPYIDISVDETDLAMLTPGGTVEVVFDAIPDSTFTGKIVQIDPQLVSQGQYSVAQATVQLDESAGQVLENFPLGLSASVDVIYKQAEDALLLPLQAVREIGDKEYAVFVLESDGILRLHTVQVGLMDDTRAEILSGLNQGDVVSTGLTQVTK
jgi:HlyD family secretion protein